MKKATFRASVRVGTATLITGWQLRCGAVVHRALPVGRWGLKDDVWTVSDPVAGGRLSSGWSMGEAVRNYRSVRAAYGDRYPEKLALARQAMARQAETEKAAS
ncbi:hypothetical protein [Acidovorax sp. LjRoot117]|uniref:hypothetical protein n=1 Tax=Acidovorax sp. LjRoot117 TaxID=3342255 RepID=UPI003ECF2691